MDRTHEEIEKTIICFLEGKASEEEIQFLEAWKLASEENAKLYYQLKNLWEISEIPVASQKISIERAYKNVQKRISKHYGLWQSWQRIAAVLIFPLLLYQVYLFFSLQKTKEQNFAYYEIQVPEGSRSRIALPDGSQVMLNAGSVLRYPSQFVNNKREVYLQGEGYFEVMSDKTHPFVVNTRTIQVVATGTKFNVQALPGRKVVEVALVSGVVAVKHTGNKQQAITLAQLKPNQTLTFNTFSKNIEVKDENTYKYIAWKDGKIVFRNDPLSYVIERLSYIYNVDIVVAEDSLLNYRYRATFENETIDEILKLLKLTAPITYREEKREKLADHSFSKRRFVIYPIKNK
ncbi:MAG: FecR family protein [Bacteroidales bacterium]